MSESYGTEFEIRQEIEKRTTKEILQKLKLWLHRPTEDIGIINTEMLMLEKIEKDLEVLEMLKILFKCSPTYNELVLKDIRTNIILKMSLLSKEDYKKIKEWLKK